jgi:hypothetical protein
MEGWIKIHRKLLDWEWYQDNNTKIVFIHCLLRANHKDKKWRGILIKNGQFITSIAGLKKELGLGVQQIRTALNKLKLTNEITRSTTSTYTIITICNWQDYQQDNKLNNKRVTNEKQTSNKRVTTNKNIKNDKNEKNIDNKYNTLTSLQEKDFLEIAEKYQVPLSFVMSKYDDVLIWAEQPWNKSKIKGRNWRLTLMAWVKKDAVKIINSQKQYAQKQGIDARHDKPMTKEQLEGFRKKFDKAVRLSEQSK